MKPKQAEIIRHSMSLFNREGALLNKSDFG